MIFQVLLRQKVDSVPRTLVHTCNLVLGGLRKEASKFNVRIEYLKKKKTGKERGKEGFCEADCL